MKLALTVLPGIDYNIIALAPYTNGYFRIIGISHFITAIDAINNEGIPYTISPGFANWGFVLNTI